MNKPGDTKSSRLANVFLGVGVLGALLVAVHFVAHVAIIGHVWNNAPTAADAMDAANQGIGDGDFFGPTALVILLVITFGSLAAFYVLRSNK